MALAGAPVVGRYQTSGIGTGAVVLTSDPDAIGRAAALLIAGLGWIDGLASRFRADSELSRLNASPEMPFRASAELVELLEVALRSARLTGGLVTPTVGAALCAAGYDRDFAAMPLDQDGPLPAEAPVPAWQGVEVDARSASVRLRSGVQLDLGATAKAWAADRLAADAAASLGCGVLVSLGGDLSVAGPPPQGGWSVGVAETWDTGGSDAGPAVCVLTGGMATSGTAARAWRRAGRPVHHLIDPRTGLPAQSRWRSVTGAAATGVDANTASTASVILGAAAPEWLATRGLPARLLCTSGRVVRVGDWPDASRSRADG
jgi:thiamine biosynthesis lipoprotein